METRDPAPTPPPSPSPFDPSAVPGAAVGTTGYAKADLVKRFLAMLIDAVIAWVIALILGIGGTTLYGVGLLIGAGYILARDGLSLDFADLRSVGKKFIKLRPVRLDGGAMDLNASIRRNWPLALGSVLWGIASMAGGAYMFFLAGLFGILAWLGSLLGLVEGILVIVDQDGRRIGDKVANTQVIETAE
ncbi:MAG: RDD family protein [Rubricoccaceae bacterium]|nr:RDD family protein [Rubricoccaceae bacterium]